MNTRRTLIPSLVLAAVLLGACGDDDDEAVVEDPTEQVTDDTAAPEAPGPEVVTMEQSRFAPEVLEVAAGTEVTFENLDPYAHTVTSTEDSPLEFDSGQLDEGDTFQQTFDEAGTYAYFCEVHPTMRAEVVVG